jgi:hypothetical protein
MKTCYDIVLNRIVLSEQEQNPILVFTNPDDLEREKVVL